jgi:hypothetical protein
MQDTSISPGSAARAALAVTPKALRRMLGRARFVKTDARFEFRKGGLTIGLWLPDRASTRYPAGWWPIRRATLDWRRFDVSVAKALNYEFQINCEKPYALLTDVTCRPNELRFTFDDDAMHIRVGVSQHDVSCRRTDTVREDWGIPAWAVTILPMDAPLVMTRGASHNS